jgi:hypothetical protein
MTTGVATTFSSSSVLHERLKAHAAIACVGQALQP